MHFFCKFVNVKPFFLESYFTASHVVVMHSSFFWKCYFVCLGRRRQNHHNILSFYVFFAVWITSLLSLLPKTQSSLLKVKKVSRGKVQKILVKSEEKSQMTHQIKPDLKTNLNWILVALIYMLLNLTTCQFVCQNPIWYYLFDKKGQPKKSNALYNISKNWPFLQH